MLLPDDLNESSVKRNSELEEQQPICSGDPIQIIVFPPPNKKFKFDEKTTSIQIQPVELECESKECMTSHDEIVCVNVTEDEVPLKKGESTLTPAVENLTISLNTIEKSLENSLSKQSKIEWDDCSVVEILKIEKCYKSSKLGKHCFLKGCKWSPDGLCLLTNSEDNTLRLFDVPENLIYGSFNNLDPVLQMKEGGTIFDYVWYPKMNSYDPVTCVFASTSQNAPIHLWDAYSGQLRATYQPIDQCDEVTPSYSLAFSPDGLRLYSGFKKSVRIFNIDQPGRRSDYRKLKVKGNPIFQSNIASSISINPTMPDMYVVGCYDRTIGVYSEPDGDLLFILKGHSGGVTQVQFCSDGNYLFSGGRKDPEILCWDIRNPGKLVFSIERQVDTHQRIQFDLAPNQYSLITGTTNGGIKLYNIKNSPNDRGILQPVVHWKGHEDCVNGINFHPSIKIFSSASGQRHVRPICYKQYDSDYDDGDDSKDEDIRVSDITIENSVKFWSFNGW